LEAQSQLLSHADLITVNQIMPI